MNELVGFTLWVLGVVIMALWVSMTLRRLRQLEDCCRQVCEILNLQFAGPPKKPERHRDHGSIELPKPPPGTKNPWDEVIQQEVRSQNISERIKAVAEALEGTGKFPAGVWLSLICTKCGHRERIETTDEIDLRNWGCAICGNPAMGTGVDLATDEGN